jgi:hypothetical protein
MSFMRRSSGFSTAMKATRPFDFAPDDVVATGDDRERHDDEQGGLPRPRLRRQRVHAPRPNEWLNGVGDRFIGAAKLKRR